MTSTKIIATIGPACDSPQKITELYKAGMRIARLNFSHGAYDYFEEIIKNIRSVSSDIAILLDTKGPEIRTGSVENDTIELIDSSEITFTNKTVLGTTKKVTIQYAKLHKLKKGDVILIDDGLIEAKVQRVSDGEVVAKVINGGSLGSHKTVSLRGHNVEITFLSKKDKDDIDFGIKHNLDFIAASFVRTEKNVTELQQYLKKKKSPIRVISKIEHWEALDNIDAIIEASQGIMVARGDLGVEIPMEKIPLLQKSIIKKCNFLGKPVIVATQMLESMKQNPRPTRAEISDVAQAILEGADAVMLSGETASGKYPVKAVKMMATIATEHERSLEKTVSENLRCHANLLKQSISLFVTRAAYLASKQLETTAIITPTETGHTARKVSRFRPACPIYAITRDDTVMRQLQLSWGVFPFTNNQVYPSVNDMITKTIAFIYEKKLLKQKDKVVITSGHKLAEAGHTNKLEIYRVQDVLN